MQYIVCKPLLARLGFSSSKTTSFLQEDSECLNSLLTQFYTFFLFYFISWHVLLRWAKNKRTPSHSKVSSTGVWKRLLKPWLGNILLTWSQVFSFKQLFVSIFSFFFFPHYVNSCLIYFRFMLFLWGVPRVVILQICNIVCCCGDALPNCYCTSDNKRLYAPVLIEPDNNKTAADRGKLSFCIQRTWVKWEDDAVGNSSNTQSCGFIN